VGNLFLFHPNEICTSTSTPEPQLPLQPDPTVEHVYSNTDHIYSLSNAQVMSLSSQTQSGRHNDNNDYFMGGSSVESPNVEYTSHDDDNDDDMDKVDSNSNSHSNNNSNNDNDDNNDNNNIDKTDTYGDMERERERGILEDLEDLKKEERLLQRAILDRISVS
jgi:hypothetical protein